MKTFRNKTINIKIEDGKKYLDNCIQLSKKSQLKEIIDRTILGDTFKVLKLLPENSVDLAIVDPPYNLDKNFNGNSFKKISDKEYEAYTRSWLSLVVPLLKPTATVYVCCDWKSSIVISAVLRDYLNLKNRITWQREKGRGSKTNWKNGMEDIWFATKSNKYTFNAEDVKLRRRVIAPYKIDGKPKDWEKTKDGNFRNTYASNFWDDISIPYWSMKENTAHPTQKPEKLIAKLILASSNKADVILDPFLGSGTTSVVSKKLGRHYIGIEQNPQYCIWAEKRLELAESEDSIQGYLGGYFWERNTNNEQERYRNSH